MVVWIAAEADTIGLVEATSLLDTYGAVEDGITSASFENNPLSRENGAAMDDPGTVPVVSGWAFDNVLTNTFDSGMPNDGFAVAVVEKLSESVEDILMEIDRRPEDDDKTIDPISSVLGLGVCPRG